MTHEDGRTLYCPTGDHRPEKLSLRRTRTGRSLPNLSIDANGRNRGSYAYGIDRGEAYYDAQPELLAHCDVHNAVCIWTRPGSIVTTIAEPALDGEAENRCYTTLCSLLQEFGLVAPLIALGKIITFNAIQEYESPADIPPIERDVINLSAKWQSRTDPRS